MFDSYVDGSIKASERLRRHDSSIEVSQINSITPLPRQMDKFWGSNHNKMLLQKYAAELILKQTSMNGKCKVVVSGVIINQSSYPAKVIDPCSQNTVTVAELDLNIEEADMRVINQINWSVM